MERPRGRGRGDGCCCWPWLEKKRTTDVETKNKTAGGQAARDAPTFYCAAVGSFKQTPLHWRAGNRLTDPTGINARQAQLSSRGKALYRVPRRWRGRLCVDCLRPCLGLAPPCLALLFGSLLDLLERSLAGNSNRAGGGALRASIFLGHLSERVRAAKHGARFCYLIYLCQYCFAKNT